ncbi:N-acetylglucosamine-6-sulfatase-like [Oscarella lobularis]|uniref:N-acetylglucosamine-6-sulfatase-like n=1 Tax=Oscarella lobularis TaxID=121494 RepID=UPI003313CFEF
MHSFVAFALATVVALSSYVDCKPPNIVFVLTDDQDIKLGGLTPMKNARKLIQDEGATLDNFFVTTPVCCPSRATILTGLYPHNIHSTDGSGCMHMNVTNSVFEAEMLGNWLQKTGYVTGQYGKLLNPNGVAPYCKKTGAQKLPGFDDYLTMCNDGRYFKNAFSYNGRYFESGTNPSDYLTSILGNYTIKFINEALKKGQPFFTYIAPHAPHVPATPAPWYADAFSNLTAPRTPNYNYSALDHHWVVRQQQPLTADKEEGEIDELFRNRWRTLLSVDDLIVAVVNLLKSKGELDNTYIMLTSDHGYQLGQFRLPMCKLQVYEHDIRVPFLIRGPGIEAGSHFKGISGNVDIAPTIMELAGAKVPEFMNGKSFVKQVVKTKADSAPGSWREMYMIEYWSLGNVTRMDHLVDGTNNTYLAARLINDTHNYVYAEFYNSRTELSFGTPVEYELFDIDKDPFQLKNLYGTATADQKLVDEFKLFIHKEYGCTGAQCS